MHAWAVGESCPRCLRPGANYDEGITLSEEIGKLVARVNAATSAAASTFFGSGIGRSNRSIKAALTKARDVGSTNRPGRIRHCVGVRIFASLSLKLLRLQG